MSIRVLLVDDHLIVREGLRWILQQRSDREQVDLRLAGNCNLLGVAKRLLGESRAIKWDKDSLIHVCSPSARLNPAPPSVWQPREGAVAPIPGVRPQLDTKR